MELTVADISDLIADMTAEGFAPKSASKPFRLLKQVLSGARKQRVRVLQAPSA